MSITDQTENYLAPHIRETEEERAETHLPSPQGFGQNEGRHATIGGEVTFTRASLKEHTNVRRYAYATHKDFPGKRIRVQSLTTTEVSALEDAGVEIKSGGNKMAFRNNRILICAYAIVDDEGARIFNPHEQGDRAFIGALDNRLTTAAAAKVREISGMNPRKDSEDEEEGK